MIGKSYDGTLANAVAATGVQGLETIVPISAISSWYDYKRSNGVVYNYDYASWLANYVDTDRRAKCAGRTGAHGRRGRRRHRRLQRVLGRARLHHGPLADVSKVSASVFVVHTAQRPQRQARQLLHVVAGPGRPERAAQDLGRAVPATWTRSTSTPRGVGWTRCTAGSTTGCTACTTRSSSEPARRRADRPDAAGSPSATGRRRSRSKLPLPPRRRRLARPHPGQAGTAGATFTDVPSDRGRDGGRRRYGQAGPGGVHHRRAAAGPAPVRHARRSTCGSSSTNRPPT